jgi:antitoxin (DNA-binding transcriptional repressor) of toxin-antitoxin stability system
MKRANIGEMRNQLSRYLDHVRGGGEVLVFDRDRPIARLVPVSRPGRQIATQDEARLASLERRGLVRRGLTGPARVGVPQPIRLRESLLRELLAERETGW